MHEHQSSRNNGLADKITDELKDHAPFTFFGALTGIAVALVFVYTGVPHKVSHVLFATLHPAHIFLSALATTAMFRLHTKRGVLATILVGYVGAVGIGTLSDCVIPYLSELAFGIYDENVHAHAHLGFIQDWYLVNPLALLGVAVAMWRPTTKVPHAGHVLLSTYASLLHMLMALSEGGGISIVTVVLIPVVLFVAVWIPCCTSDIVFPLLFSASRKHRAAEKDKDD